MGKRVDNSEEVEKKEYGSYGREIMSRFRENDERSRKNKNVGTGTVPSP